MKNNMEKEVWKNIKGYEGMYQISNYGSVKSLYKHKTMRLFRDKDGYLLVGLFKEGKSKSFRVHRLVIDAFIGTSEGMETNHKDFNRQNNKASNLEVVTHKENVKHSLGNMRSAENKRNAKVTANQVREIRNLYASGKHTQKELGKRFGLKRTAVSDIVNFKSWCTA